jgi:hypothetical protein
MAIVVLVMSEYHTSEIIQSYIVDAKKKERKYYKKTDGWLYKALDNFSITRLNVVIFGSQKPWYEAICLSQKANLCMVSEYNVPSEKIHPKVTYVHVNSLKGEYDAGMSISTFEHTGLGRYRDPIDPDGDLKAMAQAREVIKPSGILFLAVPVSSVGRDFVEGDRHRVYGKERLPLLFKGWKMLQKYGKPSPGRMKQDSKYQPVFVLRRL